MTNKLLSPGPGIKAEIHDMLYGKRDKRWDTIRYARTVPMPWRGTVMPFRNFLRKIGGENRYMLDATLQARTSVQVLGSENSPAP